jgi:Flp pilus assembly protein TadG
VAPRRGDGGNAVVEFLVLGVVLLVPLAYLALALGRVQAATYAVDGAAREAARAFAAAPDEVTGRRHALVAVRLALLDQGLDVDPSAAATLTCSADPCLTPGARLTVRVAVDVTLPGVPAVVDEAVPGRVAVASSATGTVDAFRPAPAVGAP